MVSDQGLQFGDSFSLNTPLRYFKVFVGESEVINWQKFKKYKNSLGQLFKQKV